MTDNTQELQTALFKKFGVFFAFGNKQFDEQKVEGVKYCTVFGSGDCVPVENAKQFIVEFKALHKEARKRKLAEKGLKKIIEEALSNYECFYTWEIDDAMDELAQYNVTREQVLEVFHAVKHKYEN